MNHRFAMFTGAACALMMLWIGTNLNISELAQAIVYQAGIVTFLSCFIIMFKAASFNSLETNAESDEDIVTVRSVAKYDAQLWFGRISKGFLLILAVVWLTGCGGRIMYVEYGIDRMAPSDKARLSKVLFNNPDGRRESWYNKDTHSQYTITPVHTYWSPGGQNAQGEPERRLCREYLIDDVFPYDAHPQNRGHRQLTEYACLDPHTERWYAISGHWEKPWIKIGGPNYWNYRRR